MESMIFVDSAKLSLSGSTAKTNGGFDVYINDGGSADLFNVEAKGNGSVNLFVWDAAATFFVNVSMHVAPTEQLRPA